MDIFLHLKYCCIHPIKRYVFTYYQALLKACQSYPYSLYSRHMLYHKLCQDLKLNLHSFLCRRHNTNCHFCLQSLSLYHLHPHLKYVYIAFKINLSITIHHLFGSAFQVRNSIKNGIFFALFHITLCINHVYNFTNPCCA